MISTRISSLLQPPPTGKKLLKEIQRHQSSYSRRLAAPKNTDTDKFIGLRVKNDQSLIALGTLDGYSRGKITNCRCLPAALQVIYKHLFIRRRSRAGKNQDVKIVRTGTKQVSVVADKVNVQWLNAQKLTSGGDDLVSLIKQMQGKMKQMQVEIDALKAKVGSGTATTKGPNKGPNKPGQPQISACKITEGLSMPSLPKTWDFNTGAKGKANSVGLMFGSFGRNFYFLVRTCETARACLVEIKEGPCIMQYIYIYMHVIHCSACPLLSAATCDAAGVRERLMFVLRHAINVCTLR